MKRMSVHRMLCALLPVTVVVLSGCNDSSSEGNGTEGNNESSINIPTLEDSQRSYSFKFSEQNTALMYSPPASRTPVNPSIYHEENPLEIDPGVYELVARGHEQYFFELKPDMYSLTLDSIDVPGNWDPAWFSVAVTQQPYDSEAYTGWSFMGLQTGRFGDKVLLEDNLTSKVTVEVFYHGPENDDVDPMDVGFDLTLERTTVSDDSSDWNGIWQETLGVDFSESCTEGSFGFDQFDRHVELQVAGTDLFSWDGDNWVWTGMTIEEDQLVYDMQIKESGKDFKDPYTTFEFDYAAELSGQVEGDEFTVTVERSGRYVEADATEWDCEESSYKWVAERVDSVPEDSEVERSVAAAFISGVRRFSGSND